MQNVELQCTIGGTIHHEHHNQIQFGGTTYCAVNGLGGTIDGVTVPGPLYTFIQNVGYSLHVAVYLISLILSLS